VFEDRRHDRRHARVDAREPLAGRARPKRMRIVHLDEGAHALGDYVELDQWIFLKL
jgi:hypothetical protein